MKNIIIQTIRAGVFLGAAFFMNANTTFAAPELAPVVVKDITGDSATLVGRVSNPYKNSTVWFELYNTNSTPTPVAVQGIWHEGTFQWNLNGLTPGQTYSVASVAMEGGITVHSQSSSFTTPLPKPVTPIVISYQSNTTTVTQTETQKPVAKVVPATTAVRQVAVVPVAPKEGFNNGNSAAIISAGNGMFPTTLIGWILLLIAILIAVLIGHMIYVSLEKRNKPHKEEETETETE